MQDENFSHSALILQGVRFGSALKELRNDLVMQLFSSRRTKTPREILEAMMDVGQLDFDTFRRAIRGSSSQNSNTSTPNSHSQDDNYINRNQRKDEILQKIERIIQDIIRDVCKGEHPKFILRNHKLWSNCLFDEKVTLKCVGDSQMTTVSFASPGSREKFVLMLHLLTTIHQMIMKSSTCTRRELFYQNVDKIKNQATVDSAIRDICCLLQEPPWELGVLATSKGLIAGPVTLKSSSRGVEFNCMGKGGVLIPQDVLSFNIVESEALYILVIEKDAVFQKLLDEGALQRLGPCIFLTGKGYPDINTRLMLKLLVDTLKIPSFALVDADPHGIEIMCTYRFGSLAMSHLSDRLAVPSMRWLGIHPTDITSLDAPSLPLSSRDGTKVSDILSRPYCKTNPLLKMQLQTLINIEVKCEIEGIATMSQAYLTDRYIQHKVCAKDLI